MILKLYSYIYYRIYILYKDKWNDDNPGIYAFMAICLVTILNLMLIINLIIFLFDVKYNLDYIAIIILSIVIITTYALYGDKIFKDRSTWDSEKPKTRILKGWVITIYIVLSIVSYLLLP